MRIERAEPKPSRIFSVYLPASLYQKLINKAGKGRVSTFIKEVLEEKLVKEEQNQKEQLKKRIIAAYQRQAKNKNLQSELAL
jgi:metal-responsive CopG/Arc/MetJ family transcriptional regulator